jgi:hypothetical protein
MPFTLSHPAAIVPLRHLLRWSVLPALSIGAMAPDFPYFVAAADLRWRTHSFAAVVWFCVPAGLAVYLAFERWLRAPWIDLLPAALAARVPRAPAPAKLAAVIASLALGAATHVFWDSFTHEHEPGVVLVRGLNTAALHVLGVPVRGYNLLQHGSTLLGALVLADATRRWLRRTPAGPLPPRWQVLRGVRARLGLLLALGVGPGSLLAAWLRCPAPVDLRIVVGTAVVSALSCTLAALVLYAVWWQREPLKSAPLGQATRP